MNRIVRNLLASTALALTLPAMTATADDLPSPIAVNSGNITAAQVASGLTELGYTDITYLEGAGRYWTVRAHYDGRYVPIEVDSETGAVTRLGDPDMQTLSMTEGMSDDQVAKGLHTLGYSNVVVGARNGDYADASASRYGERVDLRINTETGLVTNVDQDDTHYLAMASQMTGEDIDAGMESIGFSDVHNLNRSKGDWTGNATHDGTMMTFWVDGRTGEVRAWPMPDQG